MFEYLPLYYVQFKYRVLLFFRKYDNFYEGEFVLYRHKTLPYAVSSTEYSKDAFFVLI